MGGEAGASATPSLADFDPDAALQPPEYDARLRAAQVELLSLQLRMRDEQSCALAVVFEGVDAAGKGGAIRRLTGRLDPRALRVYPVGPPSAEEARRHYLWRFHVRMPPTGRITVFDRSWYGRVLVERVEGFATRSEWDRAYEEIVAFERGYASGGVAIIKFWLQITPEEQLRRFEQRRGRSPQEPQAHRGGLAQPRTLGRLPGRRRGDAAPHPHRGGAVGPRLGQQQAPRPRAGRGGRRRAAAAPARGLGSPSAAIRLQAGDGGAPHAS